MIYYAVMRYEDEDVYTAWHCNDSDVVRRGESRFPKKYRYK